MESWLSMAVAWSNGGVAHGNTAECAQATAARIEFYGGVPCPDRCGSVIAFQVGQPPEYSIRRHLDNPAACRKHAAHKTKKAG